MIEDVLKPKGKAILLGNEAIVRGALESGVGLAASYPGTPSSEIGMTFAELAKQAGIYFEYNPNEKVAAEVAAGAAFSGVRSMTCFKHFGFNVASDAILPIVYHGVKAGMVIICADDPGCHSSGQSEQDSRFFARMGHIPLLEPSDPQECKDYVKYAYKLSEKFKIPILIRTTTRVAHASGIVKLDPIIKSKTVGQFNKGGEMNNMPPTLLQRHAELNDMLEKIKKMNELNKIVPSKGKTGIITNGVAYHHTCEAMKELNLTLPILKLGLTYPFPEDIVKKFIKELETVVVIEELEPILEMDTIKAAKENNPHLKIIGKNHIPGYCELNQEIVKEVLAELFNITIEKPKEIKLDIPRRLPTFCPGCPHRATFWSIKHAVPPETPFGGDVGCYILGIFPPPKMEDFVLCMGASQGVIHGIAKSTKQKPIGFIGDSTFFHAGMPGIVNTVFNKSNVMTVALDNRWTAMTGHQPNPSTGLTAMGDPTKALRLEEVTRSLGVGDVVVVNAFNIKDTILRARDMYSRQGPSMMVSKGECRLQYMRRARHEGTKVPVFEVDQKKCIKCGTCYEKYACPAILKTDKGYSFIDPALCWGCSACSQVCPVGAISVKRT